MERTTALICPKCQGEMRTYERNGIMVDQCGECRGIFLDRGELERLIDLEASPAARHSDEGHEAGRHSEHDAREDDRHRKRRSSPGSLLGDLLGGGGD